MSMRSGLFTAWGAIAVLGAWWPSPLVAQVPRATVTGTVVDSENQPLSGVLVFLDEGPGWGPTADELVGMFQWTGQVGAFELGSVTAGSHVLSFRKEGFAPRTFDLPVGPAEDRRDIGVVLMEEGPDPTATITGRITDGVTDAPVANVVVKLNGDVVALTDGDGEFRLSGVPIAWGGNQLEVGRFAFTTLTSEVWVVNPDETIDFTRALDPLPIDVGGVVASVERPPDVAVRLQGFYERLQNSAGQFITRSDIEAREPPVVTEVLRGVSGLRVRRGPFGMQIHFRRRQIGFDNTLDPLPAPGRPRRDYSFDEEPGCIAPLIFLDGYFVGGGEYYIDVNALVHPDDVEGIEIYDGVATIPVEFNRTGSACGVVAIWTR